MLDHLLFNKLKWFNVTDDEVQTIDSKQYFKAPKKIKTKDATLIASFVKLGVFSNEVYDVVGAGNDYYIAHGKLRAAGTDITVDDFMIKKSDCTPIWGGKLSLLSRLWRAFELLSTKEVA